MWYGVKELISSHHCCASNTFVANEQLQPMSPSHKSYIWLLFRSDSQTCMSIGVKFCLCFRNCVNLHEICPSSQYGLCHYKLKHEHEKHVEEEENVCEQTLSRFWMLQHLDHVFTFSSHKLFRLTRGINMKHRICGSARLWDYITNPSSTLSSSNEMNFILNNAAWRPMLWINLLSQETEEK